MPRWAGPRDATHGLRASRRGSPCALPRVAHGCILAVALLAACASPRTHAPLLPATVRDDVPAIRAAVTAFVLGEARGDESVDTLLASGADFVVTGTQISNRPRLAGVPGPGTGSVAGMRVNVAGDVAWAVAVYGWVGQDPSARESGLATFVLQRLPAAWRIGHVHSSHVERWDR